MMSVDLITLRFASEVVEHLRSSMAEDFAREVEFHQYRMTLLLSVSDAPTTPDKLHALADMMKSKLKFDLIEITSDKSMGDAIAKYIFSKIVLALNNEWRMILEYELDRTISETNVLLEKQSNFKDKIGQH